MTEAVQETIVAKQREMAMTDDEVIEHLHKAIFEHETAKARQTDTTETYKACALAEKALADRFGLRIGWKRYRERYPKSN